MVAICVIRRASSVGGVMSVPVAFHVQAPAMSQDSFDAGTALTKSYAMGAAFAGEVGAVY